MKLQQVYWKRLINLEMSFGRVRSPELFPRDQKRILISMMDRAMCCGFATRTWTMRGHEMVQDWSVSPFHARTGQSAEVMVVRPVVTEAFARSTAEARILMFRHITTT